MIEAELPDGTILEFPDGTDPKVIQGKVKEHLGTSDHSLAGVARTGAVQGLTDVAGIPDTAGKLFTMGQDKIRSLLGGKTEAEQRQEIANSPPAPSGMGRFSPMASAVREVAKAPEPGIFPSQQSLEQKAFTYVPRDDARTDGEKLLQMGVRGATGAAVLPGGGIASRVISGAAGGAASEGAGQLTEGTKLEPWARFLGGLFGGGGTAYVLNRLTTAQGMMGNALRNYTLDDFDQAQRLMDDAARQGIQLTSAEALAQIKGGNSALMNIQRYAENAPDSGPIMSGFMEQRGGQNAGAVAQSLDDMAPRNVAPTEIGPNIQSGAQSYIDDVRQGINAETNGLYTLARDTPLPDAEFAMLQTDPVFQQHLDIVRNNPLLNRRVADLPDNSVGVINQVKKSMGEVQGNLSNPVQPGYSPEQAANMDMSINPMVAAARRSSPEYDAALQTQESLRRRFLEPAERAPIGQLAQTPDAKAQAGILLPKDSITASPEQIGGTVRELVNQGRQAEVASLIRQKLQDVFDTSLPNVKGGAEQFRGAQFANNVMRYHNQVASLEAAVRALPNGDQAWTGLRQVLDALEAQGQRLPANSATAFNQMLTENAGSGVNLITKGWQNLKGLGSDALRSAALSRTQRALAQALTNPNGVSQLRQIAQAPSNARAAQLVNALLSGQRAESETKKLAR